MFDKLLVKRNFTRCLGTYNEAAVVQKKMANRLVQLLLDHKLDSFNKVLEIGAGTGLLTEAMKKKITVESYYANDIVDGYHDYISQIDSKIQFLDGDIESISFGLGYDLILANAVMQWVQNKSMFVRKVNSALNNGGVFGFSTFGKNNFLEIRDVFNVSLDYLEIDALEKNIDNKFLIIKSETENIQLCFDNLYEVLTHIKKTGTNNLGTNRLTKSSLKEKEDIYRKKYGINNKITLTYEPIWVLCKAI